MPKRKKNVARNLTNIQLFSKALHKCGFTQEDFIGSPPFKDVLKKFLLWIDDMVSLANKTRNGTKYFPGK